jgi:hypothetical protein
VSTPPYDERVSITASGEIRLDRTRLERILRLPGGLVHRNLERRIRRVEEAAIRLAPGSMGRGIRSEIQGEGRGLTGSVISTHPATVFVIEGTRPHVIRPVRARALRFTVGGRVVYAQIVHHPGTTANNFLAEALRLAL